MSWKNWLSSKSYRQATIKHAKNANPYLKETAIAAGAVVGIGAVAFCYWFGDVLSIWKADTNDSNWNDLQDRIDKCKDSFSLDQILILYSYEHTKHLVAPPILLPAAANTAIQIFKVTYCDGKGLSVEGFSTGLSNSWKQACNAAYGAKEVTYCVGNAVGYLGSTVAIDGIYEHILMPYIGDVLHIH